MLTKRHWFFLILFSGIALLIRFWGLLEKPLHHDESINAWFVVQMWQQGYFRYDPTNYHGPLLFYFLQFSDLLFGDGLWGLRAVPCFFSWLAIVFFLWRAVKDKMIWGIGAMVLALSPAFEFFGRSGIHETLLVFSYLMALWALEQSFDPLNQWKRRQIFLFVGSIACAAALKETVVVFVLSILVASVVIRPWKWQQIKELKHDWLLAFMATILFLLLLYTGFMQNMGGAADFFIAYLPWLKTGVHGNGHEKSFFYWLNLMLKNEIPTFVLFLMGMGSWRWVSSKTRFFLILGAVHFLIYSIIPYKTPWCLISIQIPLVYAGCLALWDLKPMAQKTSWGILSLSCLIPLPVFWAISYRHPLDLKHSYVYVQTQYDFKDVIDFLNLNRDLIGDREILIANQEFWPLPWWLRKYKMGFNSSPNIDNSHDIIFVDSSVAEVWKQKLGEAYYSHAFATRDSREPAVLFIRQKLKAEMKGEL